MNSPESDSQKSYSPSAWDRLRSEVPFLTEKTETSPLSPEALPDLPTTSQNRTCNFYLEEIDRRGGMDDVKSFLDAAASQEYQDFSSSPTLDQFCADYSLELSSALSADDASALKNYTGFNYKYINQVARGQWDYELLGPQTPENLAAARKSIIDISHAISTAPPLETNLVTHRGTNLDTFQSYGIHSLSELMDLKNQFFLETGFTSTSLDKSCSFAEQQNFDDPLRRPCNISIEYLIPSGNHETIGLLSSDTSYNPEQRELLIDKNSLSYISDVKLSPESSSATLQMILIPREVYDPIINE